MYESGALGQVAGASDIQQMVFDKAPESLEAGLNVMGSARETYDRAMAGEGVFNNAYIEDMEQAAIDQVERERNIGNDQMARAGTLGSSRNALVSQDYDAQLVGQLAELKYNQQNLQSEYAMWGADSMMNSGQGEAGLLGAYAELGNMQRGISQEELDSEAKGLENYLAGMQVFTPLMTEQLSETTSSSSAKKKGK